ncbi:MAG TPA: LuxR C-terminal-related transcriptional regulator [Acidimicrobiales bacterium]|nr:LuxR C-terminal-related transcriptional regulator [Acidimicrobiales bacterium]
MVQARSLEAAGVSEREAEVLDLLAQHLTNAEIAARLYVSVRTVESHVSALLRKLGAGSRRDLAELAAGTPGSPAPPARPALPTPLTSFVGRHAERAELARALVEHRLVTAVGPGGVGKTRLALAVAAEVGDRYPDGVFYVDLVPVTDPAVVPAAVAASLGVGEQPGRTAEESVLAALAGASALVVLDNCEHLLDAAAVVLERLLSACPGVVALATSRARLQVPFEWVYAVPGLSMAPGDADGDAVALFVERATAVGRPPLSEADRRRMADVCRRLDGVALAIELAAARLPATGLDGLEAGLDDALRTLAGGPRLDERHRSLRSALDWSYRLLDPADSAVLRRTAVFAAPFTAGAAVAVAAFGDVDAAGIPESLARLADRSLLVLVPGAATRYRMLETIRQYGDTRLAEAGEQDVAHARHLEWCHAVAAGLEQGDAEGLDAVADEVRAALAWAGGQPDWRPVAHELSLRAGLLSLGRGRPGEAAHHYEVAASLAAGDEAADALRRAGDASLVHMTGSEALRLFLEAAAAARGAGDAAAAAVSLAWAAEAVARFPGMLDALPATEEVDRWMADARAMAGVNARAQAAVLVADAARGDPHDHLTADLAERAVELARRIGDTRLESAALDGLCAVQLAKGDVSGGAATSRRRLEVLSPLPLEHQHVYEHGEAFHMILLTTIAAGDLPAAWRYSYQRQDLPLYREEGDMHVDWLLVSAALAGDLDQAADLAARFRRGWERAGRPALGGISHGPAAAALAFGLRGDDAARAEWLDVFACMRRVVAPLAGRDAGLPRILEAILQLHRGAPAVALDALAVEPEHLRQWHTGAWRQWHAAVWAEASVLAGHPDAAERLARAVTIAAGNPVAAPLVERAGALAGGDRGRLLEAAAALRQAGSPYQWARTLVLAGGSDASEGRKALAAMGAAEMAED